MLLRLDSFFCYTTWPSCTLSFQWSRFPSVDPQNIVTSKNGFPLSSFLSSNRWLGKGNRMVKVTSTSQSVTQTSKRIQREREREVGSTKEILSIVINKFFFQSSFHLEIPFTVIRWLDFCMNFQFYSYSILYLRNVKLNIRASNLSTLYFVSFVHSFPFYFLASLVPLQPTLFFILPSVFFHFSDHYHFLPRISIIGRSLSGNEIPSDTAFSTLSHEISEIWDSRQRRQFNHWVPLNVGFYSICN